MQAVIRQRHQRRCLIWQELIDAAHERALAGTAQADDTEDLPVLDAQVHIPQGVDVAGRRGVGLVEMFDFDHGGFSLAE